MSCEPHRPLLSAFRDGELTAEDRDAVAAHVEGCSSCAADLDGLDAVANLLGEQVPMPSPERWEFFDAELRRGLQGVELEPATPRWQRAAFTIAALAASLLIAVYLSASAAEPQVTLAMPKITLPSLTHDEPRFNQPPPAPLPLLNAVGDTDVIGAILSETQIAHVASHGLVQVPTRSSLADLYPTDPTPRGVPKPLATADASLLLYGAVSARAALTLEREVIVPDVREILTLLARELRVFEITGRTREVREAARLARERVGVARLLYGEADLLLPPDALERVQAEAERVQTAATIEESAVLGRKVDYLAFRPRGIYLVDPVLRAHWRAARWFSLTGFSMDGSQPRETRAACLIVMALARGELKSGAYGLSGQHRLEAAIEVLYGEPDELTPFDVLRCMQQGLPSPAPKLSVLAERDALTAVANRASLESEARGALQIQSADAPRAARAYLFGNTRSVEARVYTRLTHPLLDTRLEPSSLDLLHVLGSRGLARTSLSALDLDPRGYDDAVAALQPEARAWRDPSRPMPYRSSLERGRLLALSALVDGQTPEGPLPFMGGPRYRNRLLLAALCGLNTPPAGGTTAGAEPVQGPVPLIEPLPRFHARLASAAQRLAGVLELLGRGRHGIEEVVADLRRVQRLEEALRDASLDVLEGRPPGPVPSAVLREYCWTLQQLGPRDVRSAEDIYELEHSGQLSILHRCVTRLDRLYVVTLDPVSKRPRLACGAALAGGEVWINGRRLTPSDLSGVRVPDPLWGKHLERGGRR